MSKKTALSAQSAKENRFNLKQLRIHFICFLSVWKNDDLRAAVRTHSLEIREPPQKYWPSMKIATCLYIVGLIKIFKNVLR